MTVYAIQRPSGERAGSAQNRSLSRSALVNGSPDRAGALEVQTAAIAIAADNKNLYRTFIVPSPVVPLFYTLHISLRSAERVTNRRIKGKKLFYVNKSWSYNALERVRRSRRFERDRPPPRSAQRTGDRPERYGIGTRPVYRSGEASTAIHGRHIGEEKRVIHDDDVLRRVGKYAVDQGEGEADAFALGEGIVGQVAADDEIRILGDLPEDHLRIRSGLGQSSPKWLIVIPTRVEDRVNGVIEIGLAKEPAESQQQLFEQASRSIGFALATARARTQREALLEQTQNQAEELQAQQEELRQANEELEDRTRALELSGSKLEEQQAELEAVNLELKERTELQEREISHSLGYHGPVCSGIASIREGTVMNRFLPLTLLLGGVLLGALEVAAGPPIETRPKS